MGKTPLPLIIWVDPDWYDRVEVVALREKGHQVFKIPSGHHEACATPDIILSRAGHAWNDGFWPQLEIALKRARARKRGKGEA